jgi:hypothetical protein
MKMNMKMNTLLHRLNPLRYLEEELLLGHMKTSMLTIIQYREGPLTLVDELLLLLNTMIIQLKMITTKKLQGDQCHEQEDRCVLCDEQQRYPMSITMTRTITMQLLLEGKYQ